MEKYEAGGDQVGVFNKNLFIMQDDGIIAVPMGKITGIGWFVVILTLISVLLGRWIGNKLGMPILFASVSGIIGVVISLLGIRASIKDILNGK